MNEDNYSLGRKVFHTIREHILDRTYQKGDEIKEKNIGKELGVSRTPVREALCRLELEGLISVVPNKGAYVIGFSIEELQNIYEIRMVLEGLCTKKAAGNVPESQLEELEEILYLSEFYVKKGNHIEHLVMLDTRFHEIFYEACGSRVLERSLRNYHQYVEPVRQIVLTDERRAVESIEEHRQIFNAVKEENEKMAEEYAILHMKRTLENIHAIGWNEVMEQAGTYLKPDSKHTQED